MNEQLKLLKFYLEDLAYLKKICLINVNLLNLINSNL